MGKCILFTHLLFYLLTLALTIAGIAMIIAVFVSERWMVADFDDENEIHYHGLYKDCLDSYKLVGGFDRTGSRRDAEREVFHSTCTLKEAKGHDYMDGEDHSGHSHSVSGFGAVLASEQNEAHVFSSWNLIMIVLLALSGICGIIALLLGLSASMSFCNPGFCCGKCSSGFWFIFNGIASILAIAAIVYFAFKVYDVNFRTERLTAGVLRVEQEKGIAYTYAIVAAVLFGLASIFGIVCTVFSCLVGDQRHTATSKVRAAPKINYISNTSV